MARKEQDRKLSLDWRSMPRRAVSAEVREGGQAEEGQPERFENGDPGKVGDRWIGRFKNHVFKKSNSTAVMIEY